MGSLFLRTFGVDTHMYLSLYTYIHRMRSVYVNILCIFVVYVYRCRNIYIYVLQYIYIYMYTYAQIRSTGKLGFCSRAARAPRQGAGPELSLEDAGITQGTKKGLIEEYTEALYRCRYKCRCMA